MGLFTQTFIGTLEIINCATCGVPFGVTSDFQKRRRDDHGEFFCPAGHSNVYNGKSEKEKLQDAVDRLTRTNLNLDQVLTEKNQRIEQLNYSVRAQKAAKTKILNRVKNGACPCCNRHFKDLQNHFISKHPELLETK